MSGKQLFLLVIVLLAAFLALDSVFVVDQREKVLVFQLGQIKRADSEPGLHFKLPLVQNVRAFDSRRADAGCRCRGIPHARKEECEGRLLREVAHR